ncbi:hypothetical protein HMPREF9621_00605 [Cutibacterium modestum HL037PA2]|nr:hypothetical protein HMPREF9621_00605 [Cutibacterium modestum HL037PA2]
MEATTVPFFQVLIGVDTRMAPTWAPGWRPRGQRRLRAGRRGRSLAYR